MKLSLQASLQSISLFSTTKYYHGVFCCFRFVFGESEHLMGDWRGCYVIRLTPVPSHHYFKPPVVDSHKSTHRACNIF